MRRVVATAPGAHAHCRATRQEVSIDDIAAGGHHAGRARGNGRMDAQDLVDARVQVGEFLDGSKCDGLFVGECAADVANELGVDLGVPDQTGYEAGERRGGGLATGNAKNM